MRILLSGATGLIGAALSRSLVSRGDGVVALVRQHSRGLSTPTIEWDPLTRQLPLDEVNAAGPFDAVVHLAGAGIGDARWSKARKQEILDSRTSSTSLLAETCLRLDTVPSVFVSGSAIGYYGYGSPGVLTEESPQGDGFLAEVCAQWEGAASPLDQSGVRTVLARTGIVLSPTGGALAKQLPLFRLGLGGSLSSGRQWLSWISLDDEVRILTALIDDHRFSGPVNLTAPNPVTNREFTEDLAQALHRPAFFRVPKIALSVVLGPQLVKEAILSSARVHPQVLLEHGYSFSDPEIKGALASGIAHSKNTG